MVRELKHEVFQHPLVYVLDRFTAEEWDQVVIEIGLGAADVLIGKEPLLGSLLLPL
jgi:hypothetical protein